MTPFVVDVAPAELDELRDRLRRTRWPDPAPGAPGDYGLDRDWLRDLCDFWAEGFDWRAREREINRHDQFLVDVGEVTVHCVHARSPHAGAVPLVLTHGWPSAFTEYLGLVPLLTDPVAHGLPGPAFDLVLPSLPGYGFTCRPPRTGVNLRYVAGVWHELMRTLGYERYGAGGGDFGAGVAALLALDHPESVIGLHLTNIDLPPGVGPGTRTGSNWPPPTGSPSPRESRSSTTSTCPRASRRRSGPGAATTSPAGPRCRAAGTSRPWRSLLSSPPRSGPSSLPWCEALGPCGA